MDNPSKTQDINFLGENRQKLKSKKLVGVYPRRLEYEDKLLDNSNNRNNYITGFFGFLYRLLGDGWLARTLGLCGRNDCYIRR